MKFNVFKSIIATGALLVAGSLVPVAASAAGTATFSLSQSGNTVRVYENSDAAVNTVEADLSYAGSLPTSVSAGSIFTSCPGGLSAGSIVCAALGGNITGTNLVAILTFTTSTASSQVSMLDSSAIYQSSDSTDVLNHAALPGLAYSYTAPVRVPVTPTPVVTPTPTPTPAPVTTKKPVTNHPITVKPMPIKSRHTGLVTSSVSVVIILLAAFYWLVVRKRTEVAPAAAVYKLDTPTAKSKQAKSKTAAARKSTAKKTTKKA